MILLWRYCYSMGFRSVVMWWCHVIRQHVGASRHVAHGCLQVECGQCGSNPEPFGWESNALTTTRSCPLNMNKDKRAVIWSSMTIWPSGQVRCFGQRDTRWGEMHRTSWFSRLSSRFANWMRDPASVRSLRPKKDYLTIPGLQSNLL